MGIVTENKFREEAENQMVQGFAGQREAFGSYSKSDGQSLQGSEKRTSII